MSCTFITQNIGWPLLKQKNEQLDCKINCIVGIVHVYHVPQERDLQNLDLRKNIAISLDCEHINAIAIGDDGSRPVIAVATDVVGVIHVIRWWYSRRCQWFFVINIYMCHKLTVYMYLVHCFIWIMKVICFFHNTQFKVIVFDRCIICLCYKNVR